MQTQDVENAHNVDVFPWSKNFETGHPDIDNQHKVLVKLLNKLASTLTHDEPICIQDTFEELTAYAAFHFEFEEAVWHEYFNDDNWLTSHQIRHSSFLPKVLELKEKGEGEALQDIVEDIVKFLIRWLAFHIIDDDKRLAIAIYEMDKGASLEDAKMIAERKMSGSMKMLVEAVMDMYDGLSSGTLDLLRERNARIKVEEELRATNKRLEILSVTDQLTGLYNRRHFEQVFRDELKRGRRNNASLNLIMLDLDHFKSLNDRYGHSVGDQALSSVGDCLQSVCKRPSDFAFRIGGEEFAVIAVAENPQSGALLSERIRSGVEALNIPNLNSSSGSVLTVSLGAVTINPSEYIGSLDNYMKIVDERLYKAKAHGRNCVISTDEG